MPKGAELSLDEKKAIVRMKNEGCTNIFIARCLNRDKSSIGKFLKRRAERGNEEKLPKTGRPKCTTDREDQRIRSIARNNNRLSLANIRNELNLNASRMTICRRLHSSGYVARVPRRIPYVSKANKEKRISFYNTYVLKDLDFWKTVLWSDETKIEMKYNHGRMYVWRKKGEEFSYSCTEPTFKGQTRGIMVWGCMTANGVGSIVTLEGIINSKIYLDILKTHVMSEGHRLVGDHFIFQQDNAPIHTAKIIKEYFKQSGIQLLHWPPQSPDLSPIENLWDVLKTRIADRKPKTIHELRRICSEEWNTITPETCLHYVQSVTHRLALLGQNSGGYTGH